MSLTVCHLSLIIQKSRGYRTNLPVSRTVCQISQMNLDIFSIKDEKSSKFYFQIIKKYWVSFQEWLHFCGLVLNVGLCASILVTSSLWGETGLKCRKCSIDRFRGVGWGIGF